MKKFFAVVVTLGLLSQQAGAACFVFPDPEGKLAPETIDVVSEWANDR